MKLSKKQALWGGGITAALALAAWAWLGSGGGVLHRTAAAQKGPIEYTVSATGNPNAVVTVQVGSLVSGNIQALYADFNTQVQKGQLVARIDPQIFQAKVDQGQANVNAAKAAVVNAQAGIVKAQAQVSSANASFATSKANVLKADVAVKEPSWTAGSS